MAIENKKQLAADSLGILESIIMVLRERLLLLVFLQQQ